MSAPFEYWADAIPEPMLLADVASSTIRGLNRSAAEALGRPREELLGAPLHQVFATPPDTLRAYLRRAARGRDFLPGVLHIGAEGEPEALRCRAVRAPEGTVLIRVEPSSPQLSGFLMLTQKVEELDRENRRRRRAEEALRDSERRLQAILDNAPMMIFLKGQGGEYILSNTRFQQIFCPGYSEIRGLDDAAIFSPELAERFAAMDRAALDGAGPVEREFTLERDGEERCYLQIRFPVRDTNPDAPLICGIIQDLTERRRLELEHQALERAIQEAQRLESLGLLAGGIAHDFNNLLTGILTNASIAREALPEGGLACDCIDDVILAGERAAELCAQLLAYAGRGEIATRQVDIAKLAREMAHLLGASIPKTAIIRTDFAPDLPMVEADPGQLRQVIMNLIINASQALRDGAGTIALRARRDGPALLFEVSDNGCGMEEHHRARIFEPFFTTRPAGHGLGLSTVQGIIRRHNGTLDVQSRLGEGTTIRFWLPITDSAALASGPGESGGPPDPGNSTLLLVDDETLIVNTCRKLLELAGYRVITASSGREAITCFARHRGRISALVMDIRMPEMGGLEAVEVIRSEAPEIPVLLMSGYVQDASSLDAWLAGDGIAFLRKPFSPRVFLDRVSRLLEIPIRRRLTAS